MLCGFCLSDVTKNISSGTVRVFVPNGLVHVWFSKRLPKVCSLTQTWMIKSRADTKDYDAQKTAFTICRLNQLIFNFWVTLSEFSNFGNGVF